MYMIVFWMSQGGMPSKTSDSSLNLAMPRNASHSPSKLLRGACDDRLRPSEAVRAYAQIFGTSGGNLLKTRKFSLNLAMPRNTSLSTSEIFTIDLRALARQSARIHRVSVPQEDNYQNQ